MDKKGLFGLDTAKLILTSLLILAVLAIASYVALTTMRDTYEDFETKNSISVINESLATNPTHLVGIALSYNPDSGERNADCSVTAITNKTN